MGASRGWAGSRLKEQPSVRQEGGRGERARSTLEKCSRTARRGCGRAGGRDGGVGGGDPAGGGAARLWRSGQRRGNVRATRGRVGGPRGGGGIRSGQCGRGVAPVAHTTLRLSAPVSLSAPLLESAAGRGQADACTRLGFKAAGTLPRPTRPDEGSVKNSHTLVTMRAARSWVRWHPGLTPRPAALPSAWRGRRALLCCAQVWSKKWPCQSLPLVV